MLYSPRNPRHVEVPAVFKDLMHSQTAPLLGQVVFSSSIICFNALPKELRIVSIPHSPKWKWIYRMCG